MKSNVLQPAAAPAKPLNKPPRARRAAPEGLFDDPNTEIDADSPCDLAQLIGAGRSPMEDGA